MEDDTAPDRATGRRSARGWNRAKTLLLIVALACWGVDQGSKALAVRFLDPSDPPHLFGGLVTFQLVRNPGAAFSFGVNHTLVFTILSAAVLVLILALLLPRVGHTGWGVALGFVSAGILGNLTDRVFRPPAPLRGHVVDFLQLPHWAIFNVADMCVCTAAVMIVILAVIKNVPLSGRAAVAAGATAGDQTTAGDETTASDETTAGDETTIGDETTAEPADDAPDADLSGPAHGTPPHA